MVHLINSSESCSQSSVTFSFRELITKNAIKRDSIIQMEHGSSLIYGYENDTYLKLYNILDSYSCLCKI